MRNPVKVRCPQCAAESLWDATNKFRPFCSQRCKLIDLGAWASEAYRMPVDDDPDRLADSPKSE